MNLFAFVIQSPVTGSGNQHSRPVHRRLTKYAFQIFSLLRCAEFICLKSAINIFEYALDRQTVSVTVVSVYRQRTKRARSPIQTLKYCAHIAPGIGTFNIVVCQNAKHCRGVLETRSCLFCTWCNVFHRLNQIDKARSGRVNTLRQDIRNAFDFCYRQLKCGLHSRERASRIAGLKSGSLPQGHCRTCGCEHLIRVIT
ncbi:hypothetical protein D3C76_1037170 [compost metagenome]